MLLVLNHMCSCQRWKLARPPLPDCHLVVTQICTASTSQILPNGLGGRLYFACFIGLPLVFLVSSVYYSSKPWLWHGTSVSHGPCLNIPLVKAVGLPDAPLSAEKNIGVPWPRWEQESNWFLPLSCLCFLFQYEFIYFILLHQIAHKTLLLFVQTETSVCFWKKKKSTADI